MRRALDGLSRRCAVALSLLLLGACATADRTPGAPWLLGATALSMAGMRPEGPDLYDAPVRVSETLKLAAIAAGADHTCALDTEGAAYCWGSNQQGQLGRAGPAGTCGSAAVQCSSVPVRIEGVPRFTTLAASLWGACGLDAAGRVHCWGAQGGAPAAGSAPLVAISFSGSHGCGIDAARDAFCWGNNQFGQLGVGSSGLGGGVRESAVPLAVQGSAKLETLAVGAGYSCGLDAAGSRYCWGQSFADAAAAPRAPDRASIPHSTLPVLVETSAPAHLALAAGTTQACGLSADGRIDCFTTTPSRGGGRAWRVASEQAFVAVAVGGQHACAIGADALAYCWGLNHAGQVGRPPTGRRVR